MIKYFSRLNKVIIVSIVIIFTGTNSFANNAYFGSWENITTGDRVDILDGFKTGVGPVLSIKMMAAYLLISGRILTVNSA